MRVVWLVAILVGELVADGFVPERPGDGPTAYLITFACYGTRLHGDPRGSVDRLHNVPGTPMVAPDVDRERFERRLSGRSPIKLGTDERFVVLSAICRYASKRDWLLYAVHVRSNHVHIVAEANASPEKVMTQFKASASRALNRSGQPREKRWAYHGSTRYLWQPRQISAAIDYVLNQQGQPMALYRNPEPWKAIGSAKQRPPSPER